jgi:transposase
MTIPAVGPITALTWALKVGEVKRFSSIKKAISYCGLCGAEKRSTDTTQRTPHVQTILIEGYIQRSPGWYARGKLESVS